MSTPATPGISDREQAEIDRANASDLQPVVFVHGLWLLPSSWDMWKDLFESNGYVALAPDWPGDPATVTAARAKPELMAGTGIGNVVDHMSALIKKLMQKPAIVGHSFGGLFVQMLAGLGLASATVAVDPAPSRGVLPLPISALKSAFPVLRSPANRNKAVMLTYEQFRYAFVNAVPESEAKELYETYPVPGSGKPLFQAALANINPGTEAKADAKNFARGPMKIISGELDHTVPKALAHGAFKRQQHNPAVTEFEEIAGRGHSLVIDSGWEAVATSALTFIQSHKP